MQNQKAFKDFTEQVKERIARFLAFREDEIGDPAQWKMRTVSLSPTHCQASIERVDDHERCLSFSLPRLPEGVSHAEKISYRQAVNDICQDYGIHPYEPRTTKMSPEVIEGVQKGDHEAWRHFVTGNRQVKRLASKYAKHYAKTLHEKEDVVNEVFTALFQKYQNGSYDRTDSPTPTASRETYQFVTRHKRFAKQARPLAGLDIVREEYDGSYEALDKLPELLDRARSRMTDRQRGILDKLVEDPSREKIQLGKELGISHAGLYKNIEKIRSHIADVAQEPGFEVAAAAMQRFLQPRQRDR